MITTCCDKIRRISRKNSIPYPFVMLCQCQTQSGCRWYSTCTWFITTITTVVRSIISIGRDDIMSCNIKYLGSLIRTTSDELTTIRGYFGFEEVGSSRMGSEFGQWDEIGRIGWIPYKYRTVIIGSNASSSIVGYIHRLNRHPFPTRRGGG